MTHDDVGYLAATGADDREARGTFPRVPLSSWCYAVGRLYSPRRLWYFGLFQLDNCM